MTILDAMLAQFERDGYPLSLVRYVNAHPEKSFETCLREWMEKPLMGKDI
jgi:hypothetical protein